MTYILKCRPGFHVSAYLKHSDRIMQVVPRLTKHAVSVGFTLSQKTHGRMNVIGVKPAAPIRPIRSAKKGTQMAIKVVTTTYKLRTTARISLGCFDGHIWFFVMKVSMFSNTG